MTTNEANTNVTRQDVTCCVNTTNPARKLVDQSRNENDVIALCEKDTLTQDVSSSPQLGAVNQMDINELEDDNNEHVILIEVTDTGVQANSKNKNQENTETYTNNLVTSEFNLKKTAVTVSRNCDNRGLEAQTKENLIQISNICSKATEYQYAVCSRCLKFRVCKYIPSMRTYFCAETCLEGSSTPGKIGENNNRQSVETILPPKFRICTFCKLPNVAKKITLTWETMEFCCVECLSRYQIQYGSFCFFCRCLVRLPSMGKYAVKLGFEIRQFCSELCLEEFKKNKKSCRHCQVDLTNEKSVARIRIDAGESDAVQEFCSKSCFHNHKLLLSGSKIPPPDVHDFCTVCARKKPVEIQVVQDSDPISLCSYICFKTFRFANSMKKINHCNVCKKFFLPGLPNSLFSYHNGILLDFCCKICHNISLLMKRKIVSCYWCKVKKYDHDMIKQTSALGELGGGCVTVCSINCLTLYQVSLRALSKSKLKCDLCSKFALAQFNLILSDTSTRHFCSYECIRNFQAGHCETSSVLLKKDKPDSVPITFEFSAASQNLNSTAVKTVHPSAFPTSKLEVPLNECSATNTNLPKIDLALKTRNDRYQKIVVELPEPKNSANKFTQCEPSTNDGECQTDEFLKYPLVLPIPVPVYVPFPVPVHCIPIPVPIAVTQPCPVPVLIPTPEKTYQSIMFQKKITPADSSNGTVMTDGMLPVSEENDELENIGSKSIDVNTSSAEGTSDDGKFPQTALDKILHISQKTENKLAIQSPVVDFKAEQASDVIKPETRIKDVGEKIPQNVKLSRKERILMDITRDIEKKNKTVTPIVIMKAKSAPDLIKPEKQVKDYGKKVPRTVQLGRNVKNKELDKIMQTHQKTGNKHANKDPVVELEAKPVSAVLKPQAQIKEGDISGNPSRACVEKSLLRKRTSELTTGPSNSKRSRPEHVINSKPDNDKILKSQSSNSLSSLLLLEVKQTRANPPLSSKVSDGFSVWKQWLTATNAKIKKSAGLANKRPKFFSTNILKLTVGELNFLLCKFVKEIRQPNGAEYAADSIYYLCLCIQHYLFENGCINDIFMDNLYLPFINALDEVIRKFSGIKDTSSVEEDLLWECEQLGGHSPHVLVATLLFFNTKFFKVLTLEEHMQISFSNIVRMKDRSSSTSASSSKAVVLRFYPPAAFGVPKSLKKNYFDVHEDKENLLRCPVRLFEFYLSKCHGSVRQRKDVFYLQPEGSCLPDSPVWFAKTPLPKDILLKMLHRIQMVKEIYI